MPLEVTLVGDLLMVSEGDLDALEDSPVAIEKMIAAMKAGTISEAEFVEWVCLRLRVAEALGGEATA
jgi:hypothetical protein